MALGLRMRCSMLLSDIPIRSLATSRGLGYSLAHGDTCELQPPPTSHYGLVHGRRSVGLRKGNQAGVAEADSRRCAIRVGGAGSQAGVAGGLL